MKTKLFAMATIGIFIFACSPKVSQPEAPKTPEAPLSPELAAGKMLYENNCGKCHKLYDRSAFSKENWRPIVERMTRKARLTSEQGEKIYSYISM